MSAHNLVTCFLVYLSIGSLIWLVLDGLGVIDHSFRVRPHSSGKALVLASAMMIVGWPAFIYCWLRGMVRRQAQ